MADETLINPQLWTGGAISSVQDVEDMAHWGITADIDCRLEDDDRSLILGAGMQPNAADHVDAHPEIAYLYNGVADDGQPKPVGWFQKSWEFAQPVLTSGGVVLAHCAAGVNRGPSTAAFLLMAHWKLDKPTAYATVKARRPQANMAYIDDAAKAITELGLG